MQKIKMNFMQSQHSYDILIEQNLLDKACEKINEVYHNKKIYIITDERVATYYLERLKANLEEKFEVKAIIIKGYESAKSLIIYEDICEQLFELGIRRQELLIALGGGVIGDLTGFIAATLYRGIQYVQIPTTLLSQVDSSIGGKTGINLGERKNVLGAFQQPLLVLIDPNVLDTLPVREFQNGMGELIKHACIGNVSILHDIYQSNKIDETIIYKSLMVKRRFVLNDEFDQKERMKLNFGHTFGHILELDKENHDLLHGEAVCLGMLMAIDLGIDLGVTEKTCYEKLKTILEKYELPNYKVNYKELMSKIVADKKNLAGVIHFILIKDFGQCTIFDIKESDIV